MTIIDNQMLWHQFRIPIDMLGDALRNCPDELWETQLWVDEPDQWVAKGFSQFWYLGYHTLFWLDLYLTGAEEGFAPPAPFDLVEMEDGESLPRTYSRAELLSYWAVCRQRCEAMVMALSAEEAQRPCAFPWGTVSFGELLLYTLRHVQEHSAQLHMFLGQQRGKAAVL
jgi:hypothetical protein